MKKLALYIAVFGVFLAYFANDLPYFANDLPYFANDYRNEPYFMDEGAHVAHSYYYRLMKDGKFNDVNWFHQASYDYLNVGRTLVGLALDLQGYETPNSLEEAEAWYGVDGRPGDNTPPSDMERIYAARWPMMIGGAFGCLAMFALVKQFVGPFTGLFASVLLAASPLYFTLSRRAMADVWVAAFELAALAVIMHVGHRLPIKGKKYLFYVGPPLAVAGGVLLGLSAGTKLNGAIIVCALAIGTGVILAISAPWRSIGPTHFAAKRLGFITGIAVLSAAITFYIEHPYFYAQPTFPPQTSEVTISIDGIPRPQFWIENDVKPLAAQNSFQRLQFMFEYRDRVLHEMLEKNRFPEASLPTLGDRLQAIVIEGVGRWSYAGRLGLIPPAAAIPATILILIGVWWCMGEGRRQWKMGMLPLTWIFPIWLITEVVVLSRELTLNWDRYFLDVVVITTLMTALGIGGTIQWLNRQLVLLPPESNGPPDAPHA